LREAGELKYRPSFSTESIKSRGEKKKEKKGPRAGKDGGKGRKKTGTDRIVGKTTAGEFGH